MKDMLSFVAFAGAAIGAAVVSIFAIIWLSALLSFPGDLAQIEQLRLDASRVDPVQAEDTIGQVTLWNQTIRSNQAYDRMFLIGIAVPDQWQQVEPIAVPRP